ncbi:MAG: ROK family protein [Acidobacteriota bacterium]
MQAPTETSGTHTIGLDLGGTFLKAGVLDAKGLLLRRARYPVDSSTAEKVFETIGTAFRECAAADPLTGAVGVGIPGILDHLQQMILNSPNLHCLDGRALSTLMQQVCSMPFVFDNDANCAALGEYLVGAGRGLAPASPRHRICFVLLTVGTGVGGGIVIDGQLWHGSRGFAGEPGHIVIERDGEPCKCGGFGCLETRVSAGAVVSQYAARGGSAESAAEVGRLASGGDARAIGALEDVGRSLGIGLAAIINLLNPDMIAIGGGVMGAGELLLAPARDEAMRRAFKDSFLAARIVPATLGNDAGIVGAGMMARARLAS